MGISTQEQVLREIELIPKDQLPTVYSLLHHFRLGLETTQKRAQSVMRHAGCWQDMPKEVFAELTEDLQLRRHTAFSGRVVRETSID